MAGLGSIGLIGLPVDVELSLVTGNKVGYLCQAF